MIHDDESSKPRRFAHRMRLTELLESPPESPMPFPYCTVYSKEFMLYI